MHAIVRVCMWQARCVTSAVKVTDVFLEVSEASEARRSMNEVSEASEVKKATEVMELTEVTEATEGEQDAREGWNGWGAGRGQRRSLVWEGGMERPWVGEGGVPL